MLDQVATPDAEFQRVADRIREALVMTGVSQTELARRAGVSSGYMSEVVRGIKRPGLALLVVLRRELAVSIDWLISGEGAMFGALGIRQELLRAIQLQVAVARAAVVDGDPVAAELLDLAREGRLQEAAGEQRFAALLDRVAPSNEDVDLAIEIYNGHLWGADPIVQRRNIAGAALAHFLSRKPVDKLAEFVAL